MTQITPVSNSVTNGRSIPELRETFKNYRKSVDINSKKFNMAEAKNNFSAYLQSHIENPTRGIVAKWEMYRKYPLKNMCSFERNFDQLLADPDIKNLRAQVLERQKSLYPETSEIREILAERGRIVFDKVKPALKGLQKFWLKLHMFV